MKITREFAMPSMHTFTIPPIRKLLDRYIGDGTGWIDPFAGEHSPAEFTNDLNLDKPAKFHLHAKDFCEQMNGKYAGILFDLPYSLTQVKACYNSIGLSLFGEDARYFPSNVKNAVAHKIALSGIAICFGWDSNGFGKKRGFEILEILLVHHGRKHHDTIVTVERKITELSFQP